MSKGYGDLHRRLLQLFVQHKTLPQARLEKSYATLAAREGLEEAESATEASADTRPKACANPAGISPHRSPAKFALPLP